MNDKQQLAAMGERIEELEAQVRVMAGLLRETLTYVDGPKWQSLIGDRKAHLFLGRIDAALSGKLLEPVAPEGWQLVPHMPTPDMCAAFHRADSDWEDGWAFDDNGNRHYSPVYQWVAMIAAAPKPEAK